MDGSSCADPSSIGITCTDNLASNSVPPNTYRCNCPAGYYARGTDPELAYLDINLDAPVPFLGCVDIDECTRYGCTDGFLVSCTSAIGEVPVNQRRCSCREGTVEFGTSGAAASEVLTGNQPAALVCTGLSLNLAPRLTYSRHF